MKLDYLCNDVGWANITPLIDPESKYIWRY